MPGKSSLDLSMEPRGLLEEDAGELDTTHLPYEDIPRERRRPRCGASFLCSFRWCTRRVGFFATVSAFLVSTGAYVYLALLMAPYRDLCALIKDVIIAIPFVGPLILFGFCVHLWRTSRGVLGSYCLCSRLPTKWKKKRNKKSIRDLEIEQDIAIAENKPNVALFAETETLPESTCCQRCNGCHPCEPSKFGWLRWITWILLATVATIVTIVIVALAIAFAVLRAQSLPNLSGSVTVKGLHQDVTINRESNGIFHVHGSNLEDVAFAQGFAHAQSRMFQMELQRRVGKGTVAEIAGKSGLDYDRLSRTLGIRKAAKNTWEMLKGDPAGNHLAISVLESYAEGVNEFINRDSGMPLEFTLLGFKPDPWKPEDSLLWAKMMSYELGMNMAKELERFRMHSVLKVSRDRVKSLMPPYNLTMTPTVLDKEDLPSRQLSESEFEIYSDEDLIQESVAIASLANSSMADEEQTTTEESQDWPWQNLIDDYVFQGMFSSPEHEARTLSGLKNLPNQGLGASNNWVVHGNHTSSGLPLLCNDPHLQLMAPSIWILNGLHIKNSTFSHSVIGSSFPGVPSVVLGHNENIAWGVTNTGADVQDLYVMDTVNFTHYRINETIEPFDVQHEEIKVRGGNNRHITVRNSVFGPVVTDNSVVTGIDAALSLHWVSILPDLNDTTVKAFIEINFAENFEEFRDAVKYFVAPSQNMVFADNEGNIGYQMSGKIPIRSESHSGAWPVPGNGSYESLWRGYLDFDDIPFTKNPRKGFIASANNQVVPPEYRFHITSDWDSGPLGYRAKRITDMINSNILEGKSVSLDRMKEIQLDYTSYQAENIANLILREIPANTFSGAAADIRTALLNWNFTEPIGDRLTPIYAHVLRELQRLGSWESNSTYYSNDGFLLSALGGGGNDPACTEFPFGGEKLSSCNEFVAKSLNNVSDVWKSNVKSIDKNGKVDFKGGAKRWGKDLHRAKFKSTALGGSPLACFANRFTDHGGDSSTVNVGSFDMESFVQDHGPSYRQIIDLSTVGKDEDESSQQSLFLNPLGQSDRLFSDHYDNMLSDWTKGTYYSMVLQRSKDSSSHKQQTLKPN